jgi:protease-4
VGSVGVIFSSFGFTGAMGKLGIERRVVTSGDNKSQLDPFMPRNEEDERKLRLGLEQVHRSFIEDVRKGRAGRLQGDDAELFSGDFWAGEDALRKGLVDRVGSMHEYCDEKFAPKPDARAQYRVFKPAPVFPFFG